MGVSGNAIVYGDNISTDLIYPGRYTYILLTKEQMAEHALEDLDPGFKDKDAHGCILVAGINFGCGSAREQAVKCLKEKGIRAIIAKSISRIYYRNCINEGLLPITCPEAVDEIRDGDKIEIDVDNGLVMVRNQKFCFPQYPAYVRNILDCGGLIASVRQELKQQNGGKDNASD
ncbi:MAG: 3-isopropylmalate dehydratase small subunit [Clostridiales bacterium]|nr:3-isopropylmalate dehydratase small subunit [Clostridiales bacterium]